jgi:hypothetical protein
VFIDIFCHAIHKLIGVFILLNLFKNIYTCWKADTLFILPRVHLSTKVGGTKQVSHILRTTSEISIVWILRPLVLPYPYPLSIQHIHTAYTSCWFYMCVHHMLAVWFIGITLQVLFNVLFVVILKMFLKDVFFTILPLLVDSQKTMYKTLFTHNAIILEYVKNGREEKCIHGYCGEIWRKKSTSKTQA